MSYNFLYNNSNSYYIYSGKIAIESDSNRMQKIVFVGPLASEEERQFKNILIRELRMQKKSVIRIYNIMTQMMSLKRYF